MHLGGYKGFVLDEIFMTQMTRYNLIDVKAWQFHISLMILLSQSSSQEVNSVSIAIALMVE